MTLRSLAPRLALTAAVLVGCYTGSAVDVNRAPDPTEPDPAATGDAGTKGKPKPPPAAPKGLPCDVAAIVSNACSSCHGSSPSGGARNTLVTYEDFAQKVEGEAQSYAQLSLQRMQAASRPMPPTGRLDDETVAVFAHWVSAGLPRGTCVDSHQPVPDPNPDPDPDPNPDPDPDPQPSDDGGADSGPPVSVCTSGNVVDEFPDVLEFMNPGKACMGCHTGRGHTLFDVAGTVFPTLHEPDRCAGAEGVKVMLIDAAGNAHSLTTNASGNFFSYVGGFKSFPLPYRAMVIRGSEMRVMTTPQTDVNCNNCHTEWGHGAPGRIMAP